MTKGKIVDKASTSIEEQCQGLQRSRKKVRESQVKDMASICTFIHENVKDKLKGSSQLLTILYNFLNYKNYSTPINKLALILALKFKSCYFFTSSMMN